MSNTPDDLLLLPSPQRLEGTGRRADSPAQEITVRGAPPELLTTTLVSQLRFRCVDATAPAWLDCRTVPTADFAPHNHDQAYCLHIAPPPSSDQPTAVIEAPSAAGLRHGLATLAQILRLSTCSRHTPQISDSPSSIPGVFIEDWPDFSTRGVMLDISRDRVPTMEHLHQTIDTLASWKINHLQLYTEHTFAYVGHEEVWRNASPITPDEARQLDRYCAARGITLAANQNCFGHLSGWLLHPRYAPLAETQGEWLFHTPDHAIKRTGPFSLCPIDPRSIQLIQDLLRQLIPNFSSKLVNIGCDETFDVGQGRSAEAVARRGRAAVYFDFVNQVAQCARDLGARPMFWADIALSYPDSIHQIPPDMIALAWGYEPDAPFDHWCQLLMNAGLETWVCPGTSSWCSITGRTSERRSNLRSAAQQGSKHRAAGYLITDWGDLGHRQQWPISLHGLAEGAHWAWNAGHTSGGASGGASSIFAFSDPTGHTGPWLDALGDVDLDLRKIFGQPSHDGSPRPLRNATALFTDMHTPWHDDPKAGTPENWQRILDRLDDLAAVRPMIANQLMVEELDHTLDVARFAARRAILRRSTSNPTSAQRGNLKAHLDRIISEHRRLWDQRSRPGGREHSCGFYEQTLDKS